MHCKRGVLTLWDLDKTLESVLMVSLCNAGMIVISKINFIVSLRYAA